MKTDLFQSCGHCWVFQICWHIECSTFTASSFRIWNSSTGIPSPPLALFVMILRKAHLTSHSKMSGSRSVITQSWLSGSWRSFLYSWRSSVYSCYLFLAKCNSLRARAQGSNTLTKAILNMAIISRMNSYKKIRSLTMMFQKVKLKSQSVQLFLTPWTIQTMEFSRPEY